MAERSYISQDLPIEKLPFAFSRALCKTTAVVFLTPMMMTRAFLLLGFEFGGAGDCG